MRSKLKLAHVCIEEVYFAMEKLTRVSRTVPWHCQSQSSLLTLLPLSSSSVSSLDVGSIGGSRQGSKSVPTARSDGDGFRSSRATLKSGPVAFGRVVGIKESSRADGDDSLFRPRDYGEQIESVPAERSRRAGCHCFMHHRTIACTYELRSK